MDEGGLERVREQLQEFAAEEAIRVDRLPLMFIALFGLFAVAANKKFADGSVRASRTYFGREMREGSASYKAARVWTVVCGTLMFVIGLLGAVGVIYN